MVVVMSSPEALQEEGGKEAHHNEEVVERVCQTNLQSQGWRCQQESAGCSDG